MKNTGMILIGLVLAVSAGAASAGETESFDGLVRVEESATGWIYVDPDADFSVFDKVAILDPHVAFRSNWQRDQNRNRSRNVSNRDVERIKADVAALFKEVFTERLEADDGFTVVDTAGEDVLLIRPAVIDLDLAAPDANRRGRSSTVRATPVAATIFIELYDSATGDILGRAADRQSSTTTSQAITWNNRVTNTEEARRMLTGWADELRGFLEQHYSE